MFIVFFFSSRRRHTRSDRDWRSDVCSSDLTAGMRASDHMEREERDVPEGPARVLAEARIPAVLALADQLHRLPAETDVALEEHLAQFCKPLERIVCARLRPMAVRPFVVSRHVDERMFRSLGTRKAIVEGFVTAGRQAAGSFSPRSAIPPKIPVMDHEGDIRCINVLHKVVKFLLLAPVVRHVADQRKIKASRARLAYHPVGGATAEQ